MPRASVSIIDHTADIGLDVSASTAEEAFAAVADAMFDIMVRRSPNGASTVVDLFLEADDWVDLLVEWLEELLYRYESERTVPTQIKVLEISPTALRGEIHEEPIDMVRHEPQLQIKAVTYHQIRAEPSVDGFEIRVIFDI